MSKKLNVYLRTYRLRSGLTQRDISFLFSINSGSTISKLESGGRIPSATILLAYIILFGASPYDLVPGLWREIENAVLTRVQLLLERLKEQKASQMIMHRISFLENFRRERLDALKEV